MSMIPIIVFFVVLAVRRLMPRRAEVAHV